MMGMPRMPMHGAPGMPNLLHMTFENPHWPPNHINPDNYLDYFCIQENPFYEKESNNQQARMQSAAMRVEEVLPNMTGIQYVKWKAAPPLYIVCKQHRYSPTQVTPVAYYYIVNGVIYQAPDLYSYTQSRLLSAADSLRKGFDEAMKYARYNVAKGYYWDFKGASASQGKDDEAQEEKEKPQQARSTNFQNHRTDALLKLLFDQFPPASGLEIGPRPEEQRDVDRMEVDGNVEKNGPSSSSSSSAPPTQMQPPPAR
ncbi:unnamed protein product, partial [Mesorhabditis spiculigera]